MWYHNDGNISDIIPELIEIGVDILNPVQPECMEPYDIKDKYGDDLVLWGCLGTQTTMPFSTPEEVSRTVKQYIEKLGRDGACVTTCPSPHRQHSALREVQSRIKNYCN